VRIVDSLSVVMSDMKRRGSGFLCQQFDTRLFQSLCKKFSQQTRLLMIWYRWRQLKAQSTNQMSQFWLRTCL